MENKPQHPESLGIDGILGDKLRLPPVPEPEDPVSDATSPTVKIRLDAYLSGCIEHLSRNDAVKQIRSGLVTVNGSVQAKAGYGLSPGDSVVLSISENTPVKASPAERVLPPREGCSHLDEITLLHEDDDLFVFSKPPGLTVHPGAGTDFHWTFIDEISRRYPELCKTFVENPVAFPGAADAEDYTPTAGQRPGLVHRLDKDTSGALIVAKNKASLQFLQSCFQDRTIKRFYMCLLDGVLAAKLQSVEAWHVRSPTDRKKFIALEKDSESKLVRVAKHACSHFQQIKSFENRLSLCRVRLDTGRTHQIRVHAAYLNKWVVGDQSYGRPFEGGSKLGDVALALAGFRRQFLHAYRVIIPKADGSSPVDVYCPPYRDMLPILGALGFEPNALQEQLRS